MMNTLLFRLAQGIDVGHLPGSGSQGDPAATAIPAAIQVVFGLFGITAVLMIAIGGFQYVISQGDPQRTTKAKNTILYAIIGLVVTVTAYGIITFIITRLV